MENRLLYLRYMFSCLNGLISIISAENFILFKLDGSEDSNRSLFFLTRIIDKRYFKYGNSVKIELCVGDLIEDFILPVFYIIRFGSEEVIDSLIENFEHHMTHVNFMEGYSLYGIFNELPSEKGFKRYLRGYKFNRLIKKDI